MLAAVAVAGSLGLGLDVLVGCVSEQKNQLAFCNLSRYPREETEHIRLRLGPCPVELKAQI